MHITVMVLSVVTNSRNMQNSNKKVNTIMLQKVNTITSYLPIMIGNQPTFAEKQLEQKILETESMLEIIIMTKSPSSDNTKSRKSNHFGTPGRLRPLQTRKSNLAKASKKKYGTSGLMLCIHGAQSQATLATFSCCLVLCIFGSCNKFQKQNWNNLLYAWLSLTLCSG